MTKSQEQRMNELFEVHKSTFPIKYSEAALELIKDDFKSGYQAAMKEAEVLVEALEKLLPNDKGGTIYASYNKTQLGIRQIINKFRGE